MIKIAQQFASLGVAVRDDSGNPTGWGNPRALERGDGAAQEVHRVGQNGVAIGR
jgi:hypothetical protein